MIELPLALPYWLEWARAFGQGVGIPAVALVGAWLAWQQVNLARAKLINDLYDRRFAIYTSIREIMESTLMHRRVSEDEFWKLRRARGDFVFLVDEKTYDFLEAIYRSVEELYFVQDQLSSATRTDGAESTASVAEGRLKFLDTQYPIVTEKFKSFLDLSRLISRRAITL